jgi:y4mF family transcriptional regulator
MAEFGKIIKERRESMGLNQQELAEKSGVTPRTIYSIETDKANPTYDVLVRVLNVLGLELMIDSKKIEA